MHLDFPFTLIYNEIYFFFFVTISFVNDLHRTSYHELTI